MSLNKLSIADVDVKDKRVFVRVDFNVPMNDAKEITNTARIEAALPTIKHILDKGAKSVVLCSHLGRPSGKGYEADFTMAPVAVALEKLLSKKVTFLKDCIGAECEAACANPATGSVFLLENVRFHKEEEDKNEKADNVVAFRKQLRALADIYCDDAFGTAHRPHSSMVGEGFPVKCAGFLMFKEIDAFRVCLENPQRPYLAIIGGSKVADKILLLKNFISKVNKLIICGGMAYNFLDLEGVKCGNSFVQKNDEATIKIVKEVIALAKEKNVEIILPVDFKISSKFEDDESLCKFVTKEEGIPDGMMGLDCGAKSIELFKSVMLSSKTIIWNGPCGVFEKKCFNAGTSALVDCMVECTKKGIVAIVGGGDSATAAKKQAKDIYHVSTGGGASIELLEGKVLPGVARLDDKK